MARDEAYLHAEKKIEEALEAGSTELDLGNEWLTPVEKKLSELPDSIGKLTQLTSLNLSFNKLKTLPKSLGQLKQLKSLILFDNQITEWPSGIWQLTNLNELVLRDNHLTKLPPEISHLTNLTKLDLRNNALTNLPPEIGNLTKLIELGLRDNRLSDLPVEIRYLVNLVSLDLRNNILTKLPSEIGQLTNLTTLILFDNHLSELPPEIGRLTKLTELDFGRAGAEATTLGGNKLEKLPSEIGQLTNLTRLSVRENKLLELPKEIGQLSNLTELDLSDNKLRELPQEIGRLNKLTKLYLGNGLFIEDLFKESLANIEKLVIPTEYTLNINLWEKAILENGIKFRGLSDDELEDTVKSLLKSVGLDLEMIDFKSDSSGALENLQKKAILEYAMLVRNKFTKLPPEILKLNNLNELDLRNNQITELPAEIGQLNHLTILNLHNNKITDLPPEIWQLNKLTDLDLSNNQITELSSEIGQLASLTRLILINNQLSELPPEIHYLNNLKEIDLKDNPLSLELAEANEQGLDTVKAYLRAKAKGQIILNEAKLILIGEGEVGKTCLVDALLDKEWQEHPTTHGIEIRQVKVTDYEGEGYYRTVNKIITLNGWDFGGQRVYRPTHQLFFSAPAVYLVVWKPREGPQQGFVKEWIQIVRRRDKTAKFIVVATHGGPQQRQPDIDRQELWDLFGKETVVDFFFVDSKPDAHGQRKGIEELKRAIASVAAELPEVGRSVPKSFADVRAALQTKGLPYLPLDEVLAICRAHNMDDEIARLYLTISHRLGHLTHYQHDPQLRDIVILRPDWLATAMSYVLDDEETRKSHGLVKFSRLNHLWDDPTRGADSRYAPTLHPIFLRLMERFDLSYRVADSSPKGDSDPQSLIAQLVPDNRPDNFVTSWLDSPSAGDLQQTQICRIVDDKGNTATAEGLFYQLIVRLHKYSLGRAAYADSIHWQRGLVLDDDYNGRALLEHKGNDVHITVRAPYPEYFLGMLTAEVKYLVESFWEGLRCDVMVPCLNPNPCIGLLEVGKLIENKKRGRPEQPCPVCNEWQSIDQLLLNAPAATQPISLDVLMKEFAQVKGTLSEINDNSRRILSQIDKQYTDLIQIFTDEAKEGPRLFSLFPLQGNKFNPQTWVRAKFRLVLWCEHSRLPLPAINGMDSKKGVYDLEFDREWFKKAVPYLKFLTGTLSLVLPVMSSTLKVVDDTAFKTLENQLSLGKNVIDAIAGEGTALGEVMGVADSTNLERGIGTRAENATLRELHALLKAKDPGFGGLVRVMNKRQEFLWVHERFAGEY